jgi:preprotein translocase subunit YajC
MNSFVLPLLLGAPDGGGTGGASGSFITTLIPFALIIGIFYFLIIRPQNKKQKETQRMLADLKKGDRVVTIGGVHGVIQSVKESTVIVKVDDNTKMEFSRSAVSSVAGTGKAEKSEDKPAEKLENKGETAQGGPENGDQQQ